MVWSMHNYRPACLRNVVPGMTAASRSLVSVFATCRVCLLRLQVHRSHLRSYSFLRIDHKVRNPPWHCVCSVSARQYRSEVAEMNRNNGSAYLQVCLCRGSELTELKSPLPGSRRVVAVHANLANDVLRCSAWDWIQQMQCHLCCYSLITKGTPHLEHALHAVRHSSHRLSVWMSFQTSKPAGTYSMQEKGFRDSVSSTNSSSTVCQTS